MATLWEEIKSRLDALSASWASYIALGSFFLYLLGYLAIRFHLTALGIGTDLAVLDERYLFAGAKFIVYLFSTIPLVLLFAIPAVAVGGIIYLSYRRLTKRWPKVGNVGRKLSQLWALWATPVSIAITGIVISVALIQIV